jgi:serine protease inhibitor
MRNKAIAVLISIVLLGGCADNTPYVNPYDRYYANLAPEPVTTASIADETQQACHKFASDLLQQLDKPGENLFFSPFSLMVVLGMTHERCAGETHRQMVQALGYDPDQFDEKAFNQQMRSLLDILKTAGDGVKLHRANGVWVDQSVEPNPDFLRTVLSYYDSQVFAADFVGNPRQAAGHINRWVSEQTNSMIDRLFAPEDLHSLTAIVLVNALYFDGKWANPFMPERHRNEIFHLENGNTRRVPMMRETIDTPTCAATGSKRCVCRIGAIMVRTRRASGSTCLCPTRGARSRGCGSSGRPKTGRNGTTPSKRRRARCRCPASVWSVATPSTTLSRRWGWSSPSTRLAPTFAV